MAERRQVARQEPIEVEVWDGSVFVARPLPWLQRNDLGTEILNQYEETTNEAIRAYTNPESDTPQMSLMLNDKFKRPVDILKIAYPDKEIGDLQKLSYPEIVELILASCDVNQHEQLKVLVDPNSLTPEQITGPSSPGNLLDAIARMQSSPDSNQQDSPENESSSSPMPKSPESNEKSSEELGTNDTGN